MTDVNGTEACRPGVEILRGVRLATESTAAAGSSARAFVISAAGSLAICLGFIAGNGQFAHWFVLPVFACGVLIGADAWAWLSAQVEMLSPIGILGIVGYHFFFLAPLLHVHWDYWLPLVAGPADWRDCLGLAAALNACGLVAYRYARRFLTHGNNQPGQCGRRIDTKRFSFLALLALAASAAMQAWTYSRFGGVAGFMKAFSGARESLAGMGVQLIIAESFPIVAMMLALVLLRVGQKRVSRLGAVLLLVVFVGLQLVFGGLRGSRSNIVWGTFWAAGLIHLYLRSLPRRVAMVGLVVLMGFMVSYSYYKTYGPEGLSVIADPVARAETRSYEGRPWVGVLLNDFGRADIQAFMLDRAVGHEGRLELAMGRTYAGTLLLAVPRSLWPDRPAVKVRAATEALYGKGAYDARSFQTSRILGLAGEACLNFGIAGYLLSFVVLGLCVGWVTSAFENLPAGDFRWLFLPFVVSILVSLLINDSDVVLFAIAKNGLVPFALAVASVMGRLAREDSSAERWTRDSKRLAPGNPGRPG